MNPRRFILLVVFVVIVGVNKEGFAPLQTPRVNEELMLALCPPIPHFVFQLTSPNDAYLNEQRK